MGKMVFILGGARSGKSTYAQHLAQKISSNVAFIATAESLDEEMERRISNHQNTRPTSWITIEAPVNISQKINNASPACDVVIVDCITLLVSNILMNALNENQIDETRLDEMIRHEFTEMIETIKVSQSLWIIVSNEVGLGIVPGDMTSRIYRDVLGKVNRWIAAEANEVYFMVAGIPVPIQQFRS